VIERVFAAAREQGRAAFIPYVMAGDPSLEASLGILQTLRDAGADLVELGIPYSDPLADGPTIAAAAQRALVRGTAIRDVLGLVRETRARAGVPVVLFTYFNPVDRYGVERFAREAADAGASGVIVPDIALEETAGLRKALAAHGLEMPLLVAPSTPRERAARIAEAAGGFVYVVSRLGVTGTGSTPNFTPLRAQIASLRELTTKPLAVGFGVSRPEHAAELASIADGIIVGSALVDIYAAQGLEALAGLARRLVAACAAGPARRER
jgi:tryptophan synthase alpha chain